jgi:16S rRNA (guanine(527)-N(7))-methyltransferase RsmG
MRGALTLVPLLDPGRTVVDVGSGGGLPGIPAAILVPELRVTLVEPRSRRTAFLRHAGHALGLELEVVQCRVEELRDHQWNGAVSEAVWPAHEWLARAVRLVEPGGAVYVLSSNAIEPDALPTGAKKETECDFTRPHDGATLWATRVRCPMARG